MASGQTNQEHQPVTADEVEAEAKVIESPVG